jgi:TonB-dependent starch-binding outer membrane protein SusC
MKKLPLTGYIRQLLCSKFFKIMRNTLFLLLVNVFHIFANDAYSQNTKISLDFKDVTVKEVLSQIESKSEFFFLYNTSLVDVNKTTDIRVNNQKIDVILDKIFEGTDINYMVFNRQIILSPREYLNNSQAAQPQAITGKVTDTDGNPVIGATVYIKNTSQGAITDAEGNFRINVSDRNAILVVSYIGMKTMEISLEGRENIQVVMESDYIGIEEVVAIGYGTIKKSDVTGSLSSVKVDELQQGVASSIDQLLLGKSAGVNVIQNSGEPGGGISINIRGASSINAGNSPLYVIDGLPIDNSRAIGSANLSSFNNNRSPRNPLSSINPSDIESIEILKDASATAIYGSRGANGVILITTKSGQNEKMKISYQGYFGVQNRANKLELLNAQEYKSVLNAIIDAGGESEASRVGEIANDGKGTDWQDEINNPNALVQDHQISFSGGTQKTTYYISMNYMNQEGIMKNTDFSRYGTRINLKSDLTDKFSIGFNASGTFTEDKFIANGFGINEWAGPLYSAYNFDPTLSVFDDEGNYSLSPLLTVDNPVALSEGMESNANTNRMMASFYGEYKLTNALSAKINLGTDFVNESRKSFISSLTKTGRENGGIAANQNVEKSNYLVEGTLNYNKSFGIHSLNALVGATYQKFSNNGLNNQASDFPNESLGANNLGIGNQQTFDIGNYLTGNRLASYIGRVNYSLYDKYLLTATIRADGSSRFGENNKFGFFPSAAIAWKISDEDFLQDVDFINSLKLRASWGQTGNQEIGNYPALSTFSGGAVSIWDGSPVTGTAPSRIPNPDLKWETTEQINIGLDFGILNNRISGGLDYFQKQTIDMLLDLPVPQSTGFTSILSNVGEIDNKGFELFINSVNLTSKDFSWRTDLTFSAMKNEVKDLGGISEIIVGAGYTHVTQVAIIKPGVPLNSYYGWEVDGIWQQGDDFSGFSEDYQPGDMKYVDQDDNGIIDDKDRVVLGNSFPDFQWSMGNSFTYKNFNLYVFIEGVEGVDMLNGNLIDNYFPINFRRNKFSEPYLNRWTPENPTNKYPSFVDPLKFGRRVANTQTLLDASYVRLKTVRLSYTLPKIIQSVQSVQVYVTGENLLTFTDYIGLDPSVNPNNDPNFRIDFNAYPTARTIMFGIKLDF